jgi:aarF domain-containing kinase
MSRLRRNLSLIRTVGSTAARATGEAIKKKISGSALDTSDAAQRLVRGLDELKGAAMKVGQMLSLEKEMLPPAWQDALSLLQSRSTALPFSAIEPLLRNSLGSLDAFASIEETACHAASMSQVHKAVLKSDGRTVAVKVRYPNLQQHIRDDLRNIQVLLKVAGVARKEETNRILKKVEDVFHREMDFQYERSQLSLFSDLLHTESAFRVAKPINELCREDVLVTEWLDGQNIEEWLRQQERTAAERNQLGTQLVRLILLEIFRYRLIQSDPNPGNFLVLADGRLGLIDFGAAMSLPEALIEPYRKLACASLDGHLSDVVRHAQDVGYLNHGDSKEAEASFTRLMAFVSEPFVHKTYTWSGSRRAERSRTATDDSQGGTNSEDRSHERDQPDSDGPQTLSRRIKDESLRYARHTLLRPPPEDLIFLNRKILGLELFLESLRPTVAARELFEEIVRPGG